MGQTQVVRMARRLLSMLTCWMPTRWQTERWWWPRGVSTPR